MGKQNNNFEYFKPQNDRESLFIPSASDSDDCKDSDSKTMFKLPQRKIMRKKGPRRKQSLCCKEICSAIVPFVIALFIIGTLISIGYIILGVNGMRREIELLKIQLNKVRSDEQSDLIQSKKIETSLSGKLSSLTKDEKEIASLKAKVNSLSLQVKNLNSTISQMKSQKGSSGIPPTIDHDLALLKKGMADTGGEIKKLSDDSEGAKKMMTLLSKLIKAVKKDISKLKKAVSVLDSGVVPTEAADTLKPFVPTTSPVDKGKEEKRSLKKLTTLLKKLVNGYSELFNNKTKQLNMELSHLKTDVKSLNNSVKMTLMSLQTSITTLQNTTKLQEVDIDNLGARLDAKSIGPVNATSNRKILNIVKGLLVDLKKHQKIIANLTGRLSIIEEQNVEKDTPKREEPDNIEADVTRIKTTETTQGKSTTKADVTEMVAKTTESTARTTKVPTTTELSTKNESSVEVKTTESSVPTKEIQPTTSAEAANTGATSFISSMAPSTTSNMTGSHLNHTDSESPTVPSTVAVSTETQEGKLASNETHKINPSVKPVLGKTVPINDSKLVGHSTNESNNVNLTAASINATGKPVINTTNLKSSTSTPEKSNPPEGGKSKSSTGEDLERETESGLEKVGTTARSPKKMHRRKFKDSALDAYDEPFDERMNDKDVWEEEGLPSEMKPDALSSSKRSKHGSDNTDDKFEALDRLDESV